MLIQEECKKSGRCTDRDYYVIVRSDEDPVKVQNGACLTAGEFTAKERPSCRSTNFYETMFVVLFCNCQFFNYLHFFYRITGCLAFTVNNSGKKKGRSRYISNFSSHPLFFFFFLAVDCAREGEESAAFFVAPQWMSPSLTKDECLANEIGEYSLFLSFFSSLIFFARQNRVSNDKRPTSMVILDFG